MRPAVKGRPRCVSANLGEIGPLAKHNDAMPCGVCVLWWERKNSTAALWGKGVTSEEPRTDKCQLQSRNRPGRGECSLCTLDREKLSGERRITSHYMGPLAQLWHL